MSYRFAYFKTGKSKEATIEPVAKRVCLSCGAPLYSTYRVCGVCFEAGKYPEEMWSKNQPVKELSEKAKKRRLKRLTKREKRENKVATKVKHTPKIKKPLTDAQLLQKHGTMAYYKLKREGTL